MRGVVIRKRVVIKNMDKKDWDKGMLEMRKLGTRFKAVEGRAKKNKNSIVGVFVQNELNRQQLMGLMQEFLDKLGAPMQELYEEMVIESIRRDSFIQALVETIVKDEQDQLRLMKRFEVLFMDKVDKLDDTKKKSATNERVKRLKVLMRNAEDVLGLPKRNVEEAEKEEESNQTNEGEAA